MLARHLNELMLRLERVEDLGVAEFTRSEILRWYGAERITKKIYRDLQDRWEEVRSSEEPLLFAEYNNHIVLVYGEGLTASPNAWLKPLIDKIGE